MNDMAELTIEILVALMFILILHKVFGSGSSVCAALGINSEVHKGIRYGITGLFTVVLVVTIIMNGLAGPGKDPFTSSTGDVSHKYDLCITPAGYTFAIWGVIYFLLIVVAVYALVLLCRKVNLVPSYRNGGAVSVPFLVFLTLNLLCNIGWLFAWDSEQLIWAAVILILMVVSNTAALCFGAYSFMKVSSDLYQISKLDFWMSIVVLNGQVTYTVWTIIAAFLNLGVAIAYGNPIDIEISDEPHDTICIVILIIILVVFSVYFVLEQTLLRTVANPLVCHYIVYLWAMVGSYVENGDDDPAVANLIIVNIFFSALMAASRVFLLAIYNSNNKVYAK